MITSKIDHEHKKEENGEKKTFPYQQTRVYANFLLKAKRKEILAWDLRPKVLRWNLQSARKKCRKGTKRKREEIGGDGEEQMNREWNNIIMSFYGPISIC